MPSSAGAVPTVAASRSSWRWRIPPFPPPVTGPGVVVEEAHAIRAVAQQEPLELGAGLLIALRAQPRSAVDPHDRASRVAARRSPPSAESVSVASGCGVGRERELCDWSMTLGGFVRADNRSSCGLGHRRRRVWSVVGRSAMSGFGGDITPRSAVVVGAGVVGLSTAWFLQDCGVHVTVVDRGRGRRRRLVGQRRLGVAGALAAADFAARAGGGVAGAVRSPCSAQRLRAAGPAAVELPAALRSPLHHPTLASGARGVPASPRREPAGLRHAVRRGRRRRGRRVPDRRGILGCPDRPRASGASSPSWRPSACRCRSTTSTVRSCMLRVHSSRTASWRGSASTDSGSSTLRGSSTSWPTPSSGAAATIRSRLTVSSLRDDRRSRLRVRGQGPSDRRGRRGARDRRPPR